MLHIYLKDTFPLVLHPKHYIYFTVYIVQCNTVFSLQHQEHDVFHFIEPSVPAKPAVPTAAVQPLPSVPAPMDISESDADAFSKILLNVQDIDANDKENPQLVSEYVNDIYEYMRDLEVSTNI